MFALFDLLLGTIVSEAVGRGVSGGSRWLQGRDYEPALRRITAGAIRSAIAEVAPALDAERAEHLRAVLAEGAVAGGTIAITNAAQLQSVLREWTAELDRPEFGADGYLSGLGVDPQRLADSIADHLLAGIEQDGRAGGALGSAALWLWRDRQALALASHADLLESIRDQVGALVAMQRVAGPDGTPVAARPGGLPGEARTLVGRAEALAELTSRVQQHDPLGSVAAVHVIHGMAGVGKTALVVHVARAQAARYPDHLLFLDLLGNTPGVEPMRAESALEQLLRDVGEPTGATPLDLAAQTARWRSVMAGRRALLVLDNVRDSEQVLPLLPGAAGCLVLVTSRRRLSAIPGAVPLELGLMPDSEASALFRRAVGAVHIDPGDLARLVAACGGVPLAVVIVAGRLRDAPAYEVSRLVADLSDARERLTELSPEELGVRAALAVSVRRLRSDQARVFELLGLHLGPSVSPASVGALSDAPPRRVRILLRDLADQHLIEPEPESAFPPRYRVHDLLRLYARELAEGSSPPDELASAVGRLARFYRICLIAVDRATGLADDATDADVAAAAGYGVDLAEAAAAHRWFAAERDNILAFAPTAPGPDGARMCLIAGGHLRRSGRYAAGRDVYLRGRQVYAELGDRAGQADAIRCLADIDRLTGRYAQARAGYRDAHDMFAAAGSRRGVADALRGLADVARLLGDYVAAAADYERAREAYTALGHELGAANAVHGLGSVARMRGEYEAAVERYTQARTAYARLGSRLGEAHSLLGMAETAFARGDYPEADRQYRAALEIYSALEDPRGIADAMRGIAHLDRLAGHLPTARLGFERAREVYTQLGDELGRATAVWGLGLVAQAGNAIDQAAACYRQALELHERLGDPGVATVRAAIASLHSVTDG